MPRTRPEAVSVRRHDTETPRPGERLDTPAAWPSRERVRIPDAVEGYVNRQSLVDRCDPLKRRFTGICAPGGFGKTTLLAAVCREARDGGSLVAWLGLEDDDPSTLLSQVLFSLGEAGLAIDSHGDGDDEIGYRMGVLMRSIAAHGAPCILALDELERLRSGASLALLNRILQSGPPNLHLAAAYREHPDELATAPLILNGRGLLVSIEELRFTRPAIRRLFDTPLSPKELAALAEATQGWPFALRLQRNYAGRVDAPEITGALAANWIETRLFRGLSAADRTLIESAGLFRRIDAELLDAVLGRGAARRLRAMPMLAGLLDGADAATVDLHPVIHNYCVGKLSRESPGRFRDLHGSVARLLGARGDVVGGVRHAVEADDPVLAGRILEEAGGIRFWLTAGMRRTRDADRLLPEAVLHRFPRLVLARCALLASVGHFDEADRMYAAVAARTDGMRRDRSGGSDRALEVDDLIYKGLRAMIGCKSPAHPRMAMLVAECNSVADDPAIDRRCRASVRFGLSVFSCQRGQFEKATALARDVRRGYGRYLWMYGTFQLGIVAFAQGRSLDATNAFESIGRIAKGDYLYDSGPSFAHRALMAEVALEVNRSVPQPELATPEQLATRGAWLEVYLAAADTRAELTLRRAGPVAAAEELGKALSFARRTRRPALRLCLTALQAEMLGLAGRFKSADTLWKDEGLPTRVEDCVDLERLGWRESECICRARLQLLFSRRDFTAGMEFAAAVIDAVEAAGLRRSLSWALALAVALAHGAGDGAAARSRLLDYVGLYARTRYARALIRQRQAGLPLLEALSEDAFPPPQRRARNALVKAMREVDSSSRSVSPGTASQERTANGAKLSERQMSVLRRLVDASDTEIAEALGLTPSGVRYHVRNIFRTLGVGDRHAAVRRAVEVGLLLRPTPDSPPPPPAGQAEAAAAP